MSAKSMKTLVAALACVAAAASLAPAASAQVVSEVGVTGRAPTEVRINLAGKAVDTVRQEVRVAARTVCRNAVSNQELSFTDLLPCRQKSASKAMRRYAAIMARYEARAEVPAAIVLSAR